MSVRCPRREITKAATMTATKNSLPRASRFNDARLRVDFFENARSDVGESLKKRGGFIFPFKKKKERKETLKLLDSYLEHHIGGFAQR